MGMYTLVFLDIKVKERSEENLARSAPSEPYRDRKIYEPLRYLTVPQAAVQLFEIEDRCQSGILFPNKTLAIGLFWVGVGDGNERAVSGTFTELMSPEVALRGVVIVGRRLPHLDVEHALAEEYAVNRER